MLTGCTKLTLGFSISELIVYFARKNIHEIVAPSFLPPKKNFFLGEKVRISETIYVNNSGHADILTLVASIGSVGIIVSFEDYKDFIYSGALAGSAWGIDPSNPKDLEFLKSYLPHMKTEITLGKFYPVKFERT